MKTLGALGLLLVLGAMPGWSQTPRGVELGVRGGYGFYGDIENSSNAPVRGVVGVEACLCPGKVGLFGEYTGYFPSSPDSYIGAGHTYAGGLRIQRTGKIRPFVDFGVTGGTVRVGTATQRQVNSAGLVVGFGVNFLVGKHAYVRPQVHMYPMNNSAIASSVGVGVGWRF
jgi:hypothetical protein